jgi:S-adenosylmethionine:tRNA ribosyltransferase-isomerase
MHVEFIEMDKQFIASLILQLQSGLPVIAAGTTSLRTLESLYWLGLKTKMDPAISLSALTVSQWDPYETTIGDTSTIDALQSLLNWLQKNKYDQLITKTQIIIAPGYTFRIIKGLITNFHQPQSTLLLLVAAIVGNKWKEIYTFAMANDFRFLSYGDGSLLWL